MQIRELRMCGRDSKDIQWITKNQMLPFPNCLSSLFLNALTEQAGWGYLFWRLFHKSTTLWAKKIFRTHKTSGPPPPPPQRNSSSTPVDAGILDEFRWGGGGTWSLLARIFSPLLARKSSGVCQNMTCFFGPKMAIWRILGGGGGGGAADPSLLTPCPVCLCSYLTY